MNPTSIELTNFKAIGEIIVVPIRPITLIFGANSSGKSSILQCLSMLAQSVDIEGLEPCLHSKGDLVDVGTFKDFINGHDIKKSFSCKFNFDMDGKEFFDSFLSDLQDENRQFRHVSLSKDAQKFKYILTKFKGISLSFRFDYNTENGVIEGKNVEFFLGDAAVPAFIYDGCKLNAHYEHEFWEYYRKQFSSSLNELFSKKLKEIEQEISKIDIEDKHTIIDQWLDDDSRLKSLLALDSSKNWMAAFDWYLNDCIDTGHYVTDYSGFLPSHFAHLEPKQYLCAEITEHLGWNTHRSIDQFDSFHPLQLIVQVSAQIKSFLGSFKVIGPLRRAPERYLITGYADNNRTRQNGGNAIMALAYDSELVDTVNWELEQLQTGYQLKVVRFSAPNDDISDIFQLQFVNQRSGVAASIRDVGFGFSQLLPIVIECVRKSWKTCLIEQPELHLHPALQTELGDLFLRAVLNNDQNNYSTKKRCLLIETHSEHLILRILRRIRETSENSIDANVTQVVPDQVAVLYVQSGINGSEVVFIPINDEGEFTRLWPQGFFAERGRELF